MHLFDTLMARAIPFIPRALIQKVSRRYIAGDTLAAAVARVSQLNAQGYAVTIDVLGEAIFSLCQAESTVIEYRRVLEAIHDHGLNASISVKPTALGLKIDPLHCEQALASLVDSADQHGTSVCIDMEDVSCTQMEIDLFTRMKSRGGSVSLALQTYLLRTYGDLDLLARAGNELRICKGIYVEDKSHLVDGAWNDRSAINPHFLHHVARCFEAGTFVAIATHDAALIEQIIALARERKVDTRAFEFQMLLGVCEPLRDSLRGRGFKVRIYVPFGSDWYGYSVRRMKENPRIAGYVLRSLLGR